MYIDDSKAEKLCDALKKNTHVLSLDLTNNELSDVGVHALCDALSTGAAPDLITLRLQDNAGITKNGIEAIHELAKTRKSIKIETGSTPKPSPPMASSSQINSTKTAAASGSNTTAGGLTKTSSNQSLGNSEFVRKYFQVGNDDEDADEGGDGDGDGGNGGGSGEDGMMGGMDPEQLSALLWDKVSNDYCR
jgi:Leucine Rich repeat